MKVNMSSKKSEHKRSRFDRDFNPSDEKYRIPFEYGWRREMVKRTMPAGKKQYDVYYYAPDNKKMRSGVDVQKYLSTGNYPNLDAAQFTFREVSLAINDPTKEIVRDVKFERISSQGGFKVKRRNIADIIKASPGYSVFASTFGETKKQVRKQVTKDYIIKETIVHKKQMRLRRKNKPKSKKNYHKNLKKKSSMRQIEQPSLTNGMLEYPSELKVTCHPKYRAPFDYGWKRILVRTQNKNKVERISYVYYISPNKNKFTNLSSISGGIEKFTPLSTENFTFVRKLLGVGDPTKEFIRNGVDKRPALKQNFLQVPTNSDNIWTITICDDEPDPLSNDTDIVKTEDLVDNGHEKECVNISTNDTDCTGRISLENSGDNTSGAESNINYYYLPQEQTEGQRTVEVNYGYNLQSSNGSNFPSTLNGFRRNKRKVTNLSEKQPIANTTVQFNDQFSTMLSIHLDIFKHLDSLSDLLNVCQVCRSWNFFGKHSSLYKKLSFQNLEIKDWKGLVDMVNKNNTKSVDFTKMVVPSVEQDKFWQQFSKILPEVKSVVEIYMCACPSYVIDEIIKSCPQLKVLKVKKCDLFTFAGLKSINLKKSVCKELNINLESGDINIVGNITLEKDKSSV